VGRPHRVPRPAARRPSGRGDHRRRHRCELVGSSVPSRRGRPDRRPVRGPSAPRQ
jgi:hypothetical protein